MPLNYSAKINGILNETTCPVLKNLDWDLYC
jgi:hypothetical protein